MSGQAPWPEEAENVARRRVSAERHEPVPVRDVIQQAVAQLAERRQRDTLFDFPTWKTIIGAAQARHAQPQSLQHGELVIHADDSSLLYALSLRVPELLAGVRQALPEQPVREIRLRIGAVRW